MPSSLYTYNGDPDNFIINYYDHGDPETRRQLQAEWHAFERRDPARGEDYTLCYRLTRPNAGVYVDHFMPPGAPAGRYRLETFIPGNHATTRRAVFTIAHDLKTDDRNELALQEALVLVDMYNLYDVWFSLGEYTLEPSRYRHIGRVRQFDLSSEDPPEEVSFGPVRWIPLPDPGTSVRFDAPVGTEAEREAAFPSGRHIFGRYPVWTGDWFDANPYLSWYRYGYHTGADLNLPGISSADKGKPVYAISDGLVTYAGRAGTWGNIIVIEHPQALVTRPDGEVGVGPVWSRYGHVEAEILVRSGEMVGRGQQIGSIGLPYGARTGWHLHFDLSFTDILKHRPAHWPDQGAGSVSSGDSANRKASILRQVLENYLDPLKFIQDNHAG